jgi:hypothetical protein
MNPEIGARCYGDAAIVEVTATNGTCLSMWVDIWPKQNGGMRIRSPIFLCDHLHSDGRPRLLFNA